MLVLGPSINNFPQLVRTFQEALIILTRSQPKYLQFLNVWCIYIVHKWKYFLFNTFYLWLYSTEHLLKDHYMGYSFKLAARVLLYAPSHRKDSTYHGICYTSCRALAGMRNSLMDSPWGIDPTTLSTMSRCSTIELHLAPVHKQIHYLLEMCINSHWEVSL